MHSSTIHVYLSGINFFTKLLTGSEHPYRQHPHVCLLLKGIKRLKPLRPLIRQPLTADILTACIRILRSNYSDPLTNSTLESLFLLAFFGFLRCSEFTSSNSQFNPSLHPCLSDLTIQDQFTLIFNLKRSKTDQLGHSTPIRIFKLNSPISPYEPLVHHLSIRRSQNAAPSDPLFTTESGSVVTRSWFHNHLRSVLTQAGYDAKTFSGHSFRIGAATTASRKGVPDSTIQTLGRWTSQAYLTYIRTDSRDIHLAHRALAS